jgi:hypothetical protein
MTGFKVLHDSHKIKGQNLAPGAQATRLNPSMNQETE